MDKIYIGIDNGNSGSIGIINNIDKPFLIKTPSIIMQDYTKAKNNITRLNVVEFSKVLVDHGKIYEKDEKYWYRMKPYLLVVMERPFKNPKYFKGSISAMRFYESQITVLESMYIPYVGMDSKEWQKALLPLGCKGRNQLKKASHDIGIRTFPHLKDIIEKQKDADGILIAEYARRINL